MQVWEQVQAKKQRNTLLTWRNTGSHSDTLVLRTTLPSLWWARCTAARTTRLWKQPVWKQPVIIAYICAQGLFNMLTLIQAFSKKKTDDRKEWLTNFMEDRRQRRMHGLPEVCMEEAFICVLLSLTLHRILLTQQYLIWVKWRKHRWVIALFSPSPHLPYHPAIPLWNSCPAPLLQWLHQQRADFVLQFWQWEIYPVFGWWFVHFLHLLTVWVF